MVIYSSQNINQEKDNEIEKLSEIILTDCENGLFEVKNECETNVIKNDNNKIKGNPIKKRKINHNNKINQNYIIITLINFILLNNFCKPKNNIFHLYYFQYSNITLKIRGIGENYIF